jgi:hypothetical protein
MDCEARYLRLGGWRPPGLERCKENPAHTLPTEHNVARRQQLALAFSAPFDPLEGRVDHELDLHTFTAADARQTVRQFVTGARKWSRGALLHIITGKGRNSPAAPVLRPLVRALLQRELSKHVSAWGTDDGEGGYLIRLRS